jgi:hypothetical protein
MRIMDDSLARLHVFNVGHGSAALLQVRRSGTSWWNMLVDGGPDKNLSKRLKTVLRPDDTLNVVVLTHIHTDHSAGLAELFRNWRGDIEQFWYPYPVRVLANIAAGIPPEEPSNKEDDRDHLGNDGGALQRALQEAEARLKPLADEHTRSADDESEAEFDDIDDAGSHRQRALRALEEVWDEVWHGWMDPNRLVRHERILRHAVRLADSWRENATSESEKEEAAEYRSFLSDAKYYFLEWCAHPDLYDARRWSWGRYFHSYSPYLHRWPFSGDARSAMQAAHSLRGDFAFQTAMASYRTLNKIIRNAQRRDTAVALVQAVQSIALDSKEYGVTATAISPTYALVREMERRLKTQRGDGFAGRLLEASKLEAANVAGLSVQVRIRDQETSMLIPGDSDLQGAGTEIFSSGLVLCPHHAGHAGSFLPRYEEGLRNHQGPPRLMLVSKGDRGDRPSSDWRRLFRTYQDQLKVFCTNCSKEATECRNCDPSAWTNDGRITAELRPAGWAIASAGESQPRCKLQCTEI